MHLEFSTKQIDADMKPIFADDGSLVGYVMPDPNCTQYQALDPGSQFLVLLPSEAEAESICANALQNFAETKEFSRLFDRRVSANSKIGFDDPENAQENEHIFF